MSALENNVRLLTDEVTNLKKNQSNNDKKMTDLARHNQELSQRLISLENTCIYSAITTEKMATQNSRLNKLEHDVNGTVLLVWTLVVNSEKDRNETSQLDILVSVLQDDLLRVNLSVMEDNSVLEKINSSFEMFKNENNLKIQKVADQDKNTNTRINNLISDIRNGNLVTHNIVNSISNLESNIREIRNHVGFTAGATTSNVWSGSTLVFNRLIYSNGGGYSTYSGVFTSPVTGTFVFYVAVISDSNVDLYLDIVLNGVSKVRTMSYSTSGSHSYQTGTNLAILHLSVGDRVWVRRHNGGAYATHSDAPLVTFSGFRL
ncbi:heavy metal-binding protein HIP-like [Saccostrea cucullata]|uniref:heavy metal-binding protein HIP-like n=1 Tax=Saccostrea cuccullata TaxID=36930 RepID=UPI002ED2FE95